jgi:glucosamine-6-phosphate deaminase
LQTITQNPDCTAIIIAAGAAKAKVVAKAIESELDVKVPATALRKLRNARFYVTRGAASQLSERRLYILQTEETLNDEQVEKILIV